LLFILNTTKEEMLQNTELKDQLSVGSYHIKNSLISANTTKDKKSSNTL